MVGILRYCIVGFFSLSVLTAHAQRTVIPNPSEFVRTYGAEPFQFSDSRNWNATISTQSGARVNVPVVSSNGYTPARIANAVKNLIKSHPLKIAGTGVGLYLINQLPGASFDPLTGQPLITPHLVTSGYSWQPYITNATVQPTQRYSTEREACIRVVGSESSGNSWTLGIQYHSATQRGCTRVWNPAVCPGCGTQTIGTATRTTLNCPNGIDEQTSTCRTSPITPIPLTDPQLDQLVSSVPNMTPQHWADLGPLLYDNIPATFDGPDFQDFTGPSSIQLPSTTTTSTNPSNGEVTIVESLPSLQLDYSSSPNSITSTPTTVTNTYQNGNLTNTSTTTTNTTTTTTPTPVAEIPTDCEFMPTVCAFIEWYRQPFDEEEPDLSDIIADDEFSETYVFSGNAQCPPPANISTVFGDFEFSYQPACQWAGMIKPLIIMAALLSAIFINLGSVRGND